MFSTTRNSTLGFDGSGNGLIKLDYQETLDIYKGATKKHAPIVNNELGIFTLQSAGNKQTIKWGNLTNIKHVLTAQSKGCSVGKAKGQMTLNTATDSLYGVEFFNKLCQDQFWDTCWSILHGVGNQVGSIMETENGRKLYEAIKEKINLAIGNSMWDLVHFGQHPLIDVAEANNTVKVTPAEWKAYKDQQDILPGFITLADQMKAIGTENFNVEMKVGTEINAAGQWIGSPTAFFKKLVEASTDQMMSELESMTVGDKPAILVSKDIFNAYKALVESTYTHIPLSYNLLVDGKDGMKQTVRNVLYWDGHPIVYDNEFAEFDRMTGTKTHRAMLTYPGNIGIGYDIDSLQNQYDGMGMVIQDMTSYDVEQWDIVKMRAKFKLVTRIINTDLMTYSTISF